MYQYFLIFFYIKVSNLHPHKDLDIFLIILVLSHLIYDLGFNHTNIESCEILHKNLDYILKKEKQTEKKEIIKKLYEKNNDIVKIITNKNSPGPSKEWLNIVASTQAKNKIKAFFTKSERDRYIERGKDSLEKEMRKQKIVFSEFLSEENLNILLSELKLIDLDELYLSIGNGKFSASYVVNLLNKKEQPKEEVKIKHPVATIDNNIIVEGIDKVKVNIANCCSPIPGDEIVGYITKGNGISVHRKSCHNLEFLDSRMINVKWNNTTSGKFLTSLIVYSETSDKAMMDITQKAIPLGVNIDSIKTINRMDGITFQIDIYVENLTKLSKFMNDISNIKYKFIGIAFSSYIIVEIENELYIINQQSANERIMYEGIKKNYYNDEKDSQMMLLPDIITLTHKQMDIAKDNMELFKKAGFELEEFGDNTIKLSGVPSICINLDTKELFIESLDAINTVARTAKREIEDKFIATIASKVAEKIKKALTFEEVDSLMQKLLVLDQPFSCPQGKSIAIKLSEYEIEKKFSK